MQLRHRTFVVLAAAATTLTLASAAQGYVRSVATPAFTKGTTRTFWFTYNSNGYSNYYVCLTLNNASEGSCQTEPGGSTGTIVSPTHYGLSDGTQLSECASAWSNDASIPYRIDTQCEVTTMVSSPPSAGTGVGGATQEYTNNASLPLSITYQSGVADPWPKGSTFDCWSKDAPGNACSAAASYRFDPGCSFQLSAGTLPGYYKNTQWSCTYDASSFTDGKWFYCVREADYAVPNVQDISQTTSDQANLSPVNLPGCGYITLDRTPPTVTVHPSATTVSVGQLVSFTASASDDLSGTTGSYDWTFGDNTSPTSGTSTSHTYTQPGTYSVAATTHDGAGNSGPGSVIVTVTNAGASGSATSGSGTSGSATSGSGTSGSGSSGTGGSGSAGSGSGTGSGSSSGGHHTTTPTQPCHVVVRRVHGRRHRVLVCSHHRRPAKHGRPHKRH